MLPLQADTSDLIISNNGGGTINYGVTVADTITRNAASGSIPLPDGIYIVKASNERDAVTKKIILQR